MKILDLIRKTTILLITTLAAVYILMMLRNFSMNLLDEQQMITELIISCVCGIWICLFAYANIGRDE